MSLRSFLIPLLAVFAFLAVSSDAHAGADATAFLGATTTPTNRSARGFALGFSMVIVGFEFEYSSTNEDVPGGAPSLRSGSVNGLLQTPVPIVRTQFYATAGGTVFREVAGTSHVTNVGANFGGGAKIKIFGPIRLRVDYRIFKLNSARYTRPQRFYAGLNLNF